MPELPACRIGSFGARGLRLRCPVWRPGPGLQAPTYNDRQTRRQIGPVQNKFKQLVSGVVA
eukprot:13371094-Alexandrium_andersonii.AAC.1